MADRQFLRLSERWALAYDNLQWVIQCRGSFDKKRGKWHWGALSFISSNRDILVLTLREKGAVLDPGKMEEVLALPYTFREWLSRRQSRDVAGHQQGGLDVVAKQPRGGEIRLSSARSRAGPVSDPYRVPAGPISGFGVKAPMIPRDLIAATLPEQAYEPEGGEDLLAIPPFLDRKAEVLPNHPLRLCRRPKEEAA